MTYVEYSSQLPQRQTPAKKFNDLLFEKYAFRMLDGIFPISEILKNIALKSNPALPFLKVPTMADFNKFKVQTGESSSNFIFCGHAGYTYTIDFILKAFEYIDHKNKLVIIIYGEEIEIEKVRALIQSFKKKSLIQIISNLNHESDLVKYFMEAIALLIPIHPSPRDEARFPHKIGEYTVAGVPIITTNFGEIKYYFQDEVNALIAEQYIPELFAQKMEFVIQNPQKAKDIGLNGRETGIIHFNYSMHGTQMKEFVERIINNN